MKWTKIEAGEYRSEDNRFDIIKTWDKIHNSHWLLTDFMIKKSYPCDSLRECKQQAEKLIVENYT